MLQKNDSMYYNPKIATAKIFFMAINNFVKNKHMASNIILRCPSLFDIGTLNIVLSNHILFQDFPGSL